MVSRETFTIPGTDIVLSNVHPKGKCAGEYCVVHNPSNHHMRSWRLHWRDDRGIFERICPVHGTGHPDPDQLDYWRLLGLDFMSVHGCCGCCGGGASVLAGDQGGDGPSQGLHAVLGIEESPLVPLTPVLV